MVTTISIEGLNKGKRALGEIVDEVRLLDKRLNISDLNALRLKNPTDYRSEMERLEKTLQRFDKLQDLRKEGHKHEVVRIRSLYDAMKAKDHSELLAKEKVFVPKRIRTEGEINRAYLVQQFRKLLDKYSDKDAEIRSITWPEFDQMDEDEKKNIEADIKKAKELEADMQKISESLWIDYPEMKSKVEKLLGMLKSLN